MDEDRDYKAYVGPPALYDFMGASQFRLLCALGLRAHHSVLDLGCGSLRAGKLLINYLDVGNYYGIEPNGWLIEEAIENQIGQDLIRLKQPKFDNNSDFETSVFAQKFDYILAQSIFSHASIDLVRKALENARNSLKEDGVIAANFALGRGEYQGSSWVYPGLVLYRQNIIKHLAKDMGLFITRIPWYHPRLTWYLLTKQEDRLPTRGMRRHLTGVVLLDKAFIESWSVRHQLMRNLRITLGQLLSEGIKAAIKKRINYKDPDY